MTYPSARPPADPGHPPPGRVYPPPGQGYPPPGQGYPPREQGYPKGQPVVPLPPGYSGRRVKPPALPQQPVKYPQLLRSPRLAWWRPLLALGIALALFAVVEVAITIVLVVYALATGVDVAAAGMEKVLVSRPGGFALLLVSLIAFIPIALVSMRLAYGTPMGYLASVQGRFRLRWALRCLLCVLPIWAALMVVEYFLGGFSGGPHRYWPIMMVLVVIGIPLQAAGEEFGFRGFLQQVIGSWFGNRWLALVVPAVLSVPAFAAAHGSLHPWTLVDLGLFAAAAVYLTWRTGGLEAACAVHAVNNGLLMLTSLALGGFNEGFVSGNTQGSWEAALTTLITCGVAVLVLTWQARRAGIQRLFRPWVAAPSAG